MKIMGGLSQATAFLLLLSSAQSQAGGSEQGSDSEQGSNCSGDGCTPSEQQLACDDLNYDKENCLEAEGCKWNNDQETCDMKLDNNKWYNNKWYRRSQQRLPLLFMGDSDIEYWKEYSDDAFPNSKNVGVGGDKCKNVINKMRQLVPTPGPEWTVLVCGENDMGGSTTVGEIFERFKTIVGSLTDGGSRVVYMGTKPEPGTTELHSDYEAYDALIRDYARQLASASPDTAPPLVMVDVYRSFLALGNPGSLYQRDRLHMRKQGYTYWTRWAGDAMEDADSQCYLWESGVCVGDLTAPQLQGVIEADDDTFTFDDYDYSDGDDDSDVATGPYCCDGSSPSRGTNYPTCDDGSLALIDGSLAHLCESSEEEIAVTMAVITARTLDAPVLAKPLEGGEDSIMLEMTLEDDYAMTTSSKDDYVMTTSTEDDTKCDQTCSCNFVGAGTHFKDVQYLCQGDNVCYNLVSGWCAESESICETP